MSKGELSQVFLKACGAKLQEEAKHYSPLAFGQVAVTSAKNLKAKSIYHVSLPDYKFPQSERVSYMLYIYSLHVCITIAVLIYSRNTVKPSEQFSLQLRVRVFPPLLFLLLEFPTSTTQLN